MHPYAVSAQDSTVGGDDGFTIVDGRGLDA